MSHRGEPGHPGQPGLPGKPGIEGGAGGEGGTGGAGGGGGAASSKQTQALLYLLVISLVLAGANFLFTTRTVNRVQANTASVTALCVSGNEARHQQIQLWTFLISISRPPPHETPEAKAQREKVTRLFLVHIHKVFAPRNCQQE